MVKPVRNCTLGKANGVWTSIVPLIHGLTTIGRCDRAADVGGLAGKERFNQFAMDSFKAFASHGSNYNPFF